MPATLTWHERRFDSGMKSGLGLNRRQGPRPAKWPILPRTPAQWSLGSHQANVARVLLELSSSTRGDWSGSIRHILEFDAGVLAVERVSFWSVDKDKAFIRCEEGFVATARLFESGALLVRREQPDYFEALLAAGVIDATNARIDPRTKGLGEYFEARGISSMLDVPVWVDGKLVGVLCHEHVGAVRRWSGWDIDFAIGAGQVVSSTLVGRAHTLAEAAARRSTFLDTLSRTIFGTLDETAIGEGTVRLLLSGSADYAAVHISNREGGIRLLAQAASTELTVLANDIRASGYPTLAGHALRQRQSLLVPNITPGALETYGIGERLKARFAAVGLRTALAVPLSVGGAPIGALTLAARGRSYGTDDLEMAQDVAERVAMALEHARYYRMARDAIVAREDFVILASHELRTPLASLALIVDQQARKAREGGESSSSDRRQVEAIARQVRRLIGLVDRMLDAIRVQSEGISLSPEPCKMSDLVEKAVLSADERARLSGRGPMLLDMEDLASEASGIWDRGRVGRALDELLDNALKFGGTEPIEVSFRLDAGDAVVTVRDHGMGISSDKIDSIFSPFERASSKQHFGGLGLGLFVARAIAEAHGGSLAVTSSPDRGATFVMRLPMDGARDGGSSAPGLGGPDGAAPI